MKTKEIEVWVSDSGLSLLASGEGTNCTLEFRFNEMARFKHPVRVGFVHDKKIEISESEFDEAWESWAKDTPNKGLHDHLKEKLFGKGGERAS